jgi:glycosyltransferase involved in cell wall biosynthesis
MMSNLLPSGLNQPLVTIVLPTYNGSRYVREAIESCLAQSYRFWELIVVDDCSTDDTPEIIDEYIRRDSRIRSIRHGVNKKLPEALNTGHAAARGEYLTWTSDDNRLLPNTLERLVDSLESQPAVGMVYADSTLINQAGCYLRDYPAQPVSALAYMNAIGPCFLYRRSVHEKVGAYSVDVFLVEDYDYWLRVYRQFEVAHLPEILYEYRWHRESLTNTAAGKAFHASLERTLRRNLPHLSRSSPSERAQGWIVCAAAAAKQGIPRKAVGAYARALLTAPLFSIQYVAGKLVGRFRSSVDPLAPSKSREATANPGPAPADPAGVSSLNS